VRKPSLFATRGYSGERKEPVQLVYSCGRKASVPASRTKGRRRGLSVGKFVAVCVKECVLEDEAEFRRVSGKGSERNGRGFRGERIPCVEGYGEGAGAR